MPDPTISPTPDDKEIEGMLLSLKMGNKLRILSKAGITFREAAESMRHALSTLTTATEAALKTFIEYGILMKPKGRKRNA